MISRCALVFLLTAFTTLAAQVPVHQDPSHRVAYSHAQLRILDVNIPAGQTTVDHRHEFDIATISMTNGPETRTQPSGQAWGPLRPSRPLGDASITEYTGKAGNHRVENPGKSAYQLFAVENLRAGGWSTAAAVTGLATKLVTESRAFRIYDVRLGQQAPQTSHTHQVPTVVIVLNGFIMSDGPNAKAKDYAPAAVGLKQLDQTGQWLLVPGGDNHALVRLGTADARVIEVEVR
jgi:hypothetical protein